MWIMTCNKLGFLLNICIASKPVLVFLKLCFNIGIKPNNNSYMTLSTYFETGCNMSKQWFNSIASLTPVLALSLYLCSFVSGSTVESINHRHWCKIWEAETIFVSSLTVMLWEVNSWRGEILLLLLLRLQRPAWGTEAYRRRH